MTNETIEFSMSLDNVKKIPFDKYESNFTFIVNGKRYKTNRFIADFLSPIIRGFHYQDPTIDEFSININKESQPKDENDYFSEFLNLIKFDKVKLDESRRKRFIQYFIELGNIEESLELQPEIFEELSAANVIDRLNMALDSIKKVSKYCDSTEIFNKINTEGSISKMIVYVASHFDEIDKEKMKEMKVEIIEEIIKKDEMKIDDEDSLLDFLLGLYERNHEYSELFEYVEFENASEEMVEKFIENFQLDDLSAGTWRKICKRLVPSKYKGSFKERYTKKFEYIDKEYERGSEFNGIMRYLTNETGGNIHENGTIEITTNSIYDDDIKYHPKNLVDYQSDNHYDSANIEDSVVCFDFKDKEIQLTSYSIKTINFGPNTNHLKNWVIEVSKDGKKWEQVDEHSNESSLNSANSVATFNTKKSDTFYRFIQLHQTGKSWNDNYVTDICLLEFHGKLKLTKSLKHK